MKAPLAQYSNVKSLAGPIQAEDACAAHSYARDGWLIGALLPSSDLIGPALVPS